MNISDYSSVVNRIWINLILSVIPMLVLGPVGIGLGLFAFLKRYLKRFIAILLIIFCIFVTVYSIVELAIFRYDVKNNNYEIYHGEFYYKSVLHEEDVFKFTDKPKFFIRGGYGLDIETGTYTGYVLYCKNSRWVISVSNTPFQ